MDSEIPRQVKAGPWPSQEKVAQGVHQSGFNVVESQVGLAGHCPACGAPVAGVWAASDGSVRKGNKNDEREDSGFDR
jgi:hypothetical protein